MKFRDLKEKDAVLMLEWMKDLDVVGNLAHDFFSMTIEDCLEFIKNANSEQKTNIHKAICNDEDEYLGTVSLKNIDLKNRNAEYAISLRKVAHGTGAAKFGTEEILKIAFEKLNLNKVYLNVISENVRAIKFYNKVGFQLEGEAKEHILIKNELKDLRWYAIYRRNL